MLYIMQNNGLLSKADKHYIFCDHKPQNFRRRNENAERLAALMLRASCLIFFWRIAIASCNSPVSLL